MDEKRLREIADMCREAIDLVPTTEIEYEKGLTQMFQKFRDISVVGSLSRLSLFFVARYSGQAGKGIDHV